MGARRAVVGAMTIENPTIKLSCPCGGTFEMHCTEFINPGGRPDSQHRVFIAELRADEWQTRHDGCIGTKRAAMLEAALK